MRINVYSQELTDEVIKLEKTSNTGIVYEAAQLILHSSERLHHPPADDDRSAVTFWLPQSLQRRKLMANAFREIADIFHTPTVTLELREAADPKLDALLLAIGTWYENTSGHDVGTLLNKVGNAWIALKAGTGEATPPVLCRGANCTRVAGSDMPHSPECIAEHEAITNPGGKYNTPTGLPDLPPIVPEMLASPNALPEAQEPDTESLDALERAGRLALVEETRRAWLGRDIGHKTVATSGWVQTVSMAGDLTEMRQESGRAFENRYHKIAAAVPRDDWDRAYLQLAQSRATCTGKEIEDLAMTFGKEIEDLAMTFGTKSQTDGA